MKIFVILILFFSLSIVYSQNTWLTIVPIGKLDVGQCITENTDGSFLISGFHTIASSDTSKSAFYKISKSGNIEWFLYDNMNSCLSRTFQHIKISTGYLGIGATLSPGDICGFSPNPPPVDIQMLLTKVDFEGNLIFQKSLGKSDNFDVDEAHGIIEAESDNLFVFGTQNYQPILYKINENADTLWSKKYNFGGYITAMHKVNDNYYLAAINSSSTTSLVAFDSLGTILWNKFYNSNVTTHIKPSPDGNFILLVHQLSGARVIKVDVGGNLIWDNFMLGQRSYDIEVLSDSEYLITSNKGFSKINDLGEVVWNKKHLPDTVYVINDIFKVSDGGFLLTGRTKDLKFYAIKLDCEGNLEWDSQSCSPTVFQDLLVYPNPTQNEVTFQLPSVYDSEVINIELYSIQGQLILKRQNLLSNFTINLNGLSQGLYVYRILVNEKEVYQNRIIKIE
jgi:hypothetical protein